MLGAGPRDADRIAFLKGVAADQMGGDLPRDADEGYGIHQRVGKAGDRIRRARTGGDKQHADLAGRAGIAFGGMRGALFVAHEKMADPVLLEQLVIDRKDRAARISENILNALVGQSLQDDFRAGHHASHRAQLHFEPPAWSRSEAFLHKKGTCPIHFSGKLLKPDK